MHDPKRQDNCVWFNKMRNNLAALDNCPAFADINDSIIVALFTLPRAQRVDYSVSTASRFSDFSHLSVSERILVVEQIWDSIAAEQTSLPLTPAQRAELDVRLEALRQSPGQGASLEEVKSRIINRT